MPIDEGKLHKDKTRAAQADRLLNDELMAEAFKSLEAEYIKAWGATEPHAVEAREHFWMATQILGDVRKHLHRIVTHGKLATRELQDLADRSRPRAA